MPQELIKGTLSMGLFHRNMYQQKHTAGLLMSKIDMHCQLQAWACLYVIFDKKNGFNLKSDISKMFSDGWCR